MRFRRWACVITIVAIIVSVLPGQVIAAGPALASGNHVAWIDRISNLPNYASDFYDWLEANASSDGALADPTKGTRMGSNYVHMLHELKGTVTVEAGAGSDQIKAAVMAAVDDEAQTVMEYAFEVYGAFDRDHPEVFWLSSESQCGMSLKYSINPQTNLASYELSVFFYLISDNFDLRLACYRDASVIAAVAAQRDRDIQRVLKDCPTDQPAAQQVRYLNHVLTRINSYNSHVAAGNSASADPNAWKCISALSGSTGKSGPVCEGYSRAFKVLCDELGIPCVLVEGYARGSLTDRAQLHMWNYVQLDGKWYAVDTTWNDPRVAGTENAAVSGKENEKYLLIGGDTQVSSGLTLSMSHNVRNSVNSGGIQYTNGPVLSNTAYVFEQTDPAPVVPKPTVPESTKPVENDPVLPDPIIPDPVLPDPVVPEPDVSEPLDSDPVVPDPVIPEPDEPDHYMNVEPYRSGEEYTAPRKDGCIFAGWFTDAELTVPLSKDVTTGYAYACFVDAEVLTIKCQLADGTTAQSKQTDLRLLTGIGTRQLDGVVFLVGAENGYIVGSGLYEQVLAHDMRIGHASDLFGDDAVYFVTCTLANIPQERFGEAITVIPGWYTLDGTFVTGTARTVCISDGF